MKIDIRTLPVKYINMDKDTDRDAQMQSIGKNLQLHDYTRVSGFYAPGFPKIGCATSHLNILKDTVEPTVILEDDCVILRNELTFEIPDDADALYIGLSNHGHLKSTTDIGNYTYKQHDGYPDVYKIDGMLATHAILYISKDYIAMAERVAQWSAENDDHIDRGLALIHKYFNVYALGSPIFYQHSSTNATKIKL